MAIVLTLGGLWKRRGGGGGRVLLYCLGQAGIWMHHYPLGGSVAGSVSLLFQSP